MNDPLHQINIAYVPKEDRLLLRVSTRKGDEYRAWLTRKFAALLLNVLREKMDHFGGAPSLAASQETKRMFKQGALSKRFDAERSMEFPLGEEGILAVRFNASMTKKGNLALQILPERGQEGITLNLTRTLLYLFYNVLTQGIDQADWQLQQDVSRKLH
ncbi:MAG: hypothetical protein HYY48_12295 [Gammaproteobacteria bacterium]|nr:hypothetical protein [Gammaproteobacteria bacterium]